MFQAGALSGLFLNFAQETDIRKGHFFELPEIKQMNDDRNGQCGSCNQKERIQEIHGHKSKGLQGYAQGLLQRQKPPFGPTGNSRKKRMRQSPQEPKTSQR